jgi:hypothetical protein
MSSDTGTDNGLDSVQKFAPNHHDDSETAIQLLTTLFSISHRFIWLNGMLQ